MEVDQSTVATPISLSNQQPNGSSAVGMQIEAGDKKPKGGGAKVLPRLPHHVSNVNGPAANGSSRSFRIGWIQGKRDPSVENKLINWICTVTQEKPPEGTDIAEWLRDGQILCKLVNKIEPGIIKRINPKGGYGSIENIDNFRQALHDLGFGEKDCFSTVDLYEGLNIAQVQSTLFRLAEKARSKNQQIPLP